MPCATCALIGSAAAVINLIEEFCSRRRGRGGLELKTPLRVMLRHARVSARQAIDKSKADRPRALTRSRFAAAPATRASSPRQLHAIVGQSERCLLGFCRRRASRSKSDPVPGSTSSASPRRCPGSSGCRAIQTRPRALECHRRARQCASAGRPRRARRGMGRGGRRTICGADQPLKECSCSWRCLAFSLGRAQL
jgi:hypothetical protein